MTSSKQISATAYADHVGIVAARWAAALEHAGFDAAVVGAGRTVYRHRDDTTHPFRADPWFAQWIPLLSHSGSRIVVAPGKRPALYVLRSENFWMEPPPLPAEVFGRHFDVTEFDSPDKLDRELHRRSGRTAWIGDPAQWTQQPEPADANPDAALHHLDYYRPIKTDWEIACISSATALAVPAHIAARDAFMDGGSEYDALLAFLAACRQTQDELPYPAIIAMNEHGAVLHYQHYTREPGQAASLLIDAGCAVNGYACDISRTWSAGDREFTELIEAMDGLQQSISEQVRPGVSFADLHRAAHLAIARLLGATGLVRGAAEDLVADGTSAAFFPHGLGHYLGLQVHDVGGALADVDGSTVSPPADFPHLRLARTLAENQVLTIEPGLYFIDSLLEQLREQPRAGDIDWERVERLKTFGGIRIEDNVRVTADGHENLTRAAFLSLRS